MVVGEFVGEKVGDFVGLFVGGVDGIADDPLVGWQSQPVQSHATALPKISHIPSVEP